MNVKIILMGLLINISLLKASEEFNVKTFIKGISSMNDNEQIYLINSEINKFKYKSDLSLYKKKDYWATPKEFLKNNGGDCEDYAIMKYSLLKRIGYKPEDMKFIYTNYKDKTGKDIGHLVLSVKNKNGKEVILDNTKVRPLEYNSYFKEKKLNIEFDLKIVNQKINKKDKFKIS